MRTPRSATDRVDGYMDSRVVPVRVTQLATLGTATLPTTPSAVSHAADVYFCFDGDRAGARGVEGGESSCRNSRWPPGVLPFLPEGEDPTDRACRMRGRLSAGSPQPLPERILLQRAIARGQSEFDQRQGAARGTLQAVSGGIPMCLPRLEAARCPTHRVGGRTPSRLPIAQRTAVRARRRPSKAGPCRHLLPLQEPALALAANPLPVSELHQPRIAACEMIALARGRPGSSAPAPSGPFADREEGAA